ncbi:DUF4430 domain-containing protein [Methanogenium sp. S4BF]|uniref:DUF4430 domain-containing protein n=1 Tax=Methanogenium sp. S4BF TaxID=1789226 RepID=UPI002417369F|nr:DUF4430 domain-containing protein [Methanogenium sp. S4BF]WFN34045.1 DUF4430 domain-containing protein [Methanogenium sp. S4BF]
MHRTVGICVVLLALIVCATTPAAAISVLSVTQAGAGEPMTVTLDMEGTVVFQYGEGTPVFGHGTIVKFIPPGDGIVTVSATDPVTGAMTAPQSIIITNPTPAPTPTPQPGSGGGGSGSDTPVIAWKTVTLPAGTFNVTADNSGDVSAVSWQCALGTLQAAGVSFKVSDEWDNGLFVTEVDGKPSAGAAGWMYQVNGASPATTADKCTVKANDEVVWYYSESMSQTPQESPKAFFYRVQISSPAPGTSSTPSAGILETGTGLTTGADAASYPLSLPPGSDLRLSEGRMYLTVNVPMATAAGDVIGFSGNMMLITRDDVVLKIRFADFTEKSGVVAGEITDVMVETTPVTVTCANGAGPEVSLLIRLLTVPMDADLDVTVTPLSGISAVPSAFLSAANAALRPEGMAAGGAGWQMDIDKRGLENGVDVGDVTVRITADSAYITEMGGLSALRLIHITDDGTAEVLTLRSAGATADGETMLEAGPAAGLSSFFLISVTDGPASSGTGAGATPVSAEDTASPAATQSGTCLTILSAAVAGILGITGIYRNTKR